LEFVWLTPDSSIVLRTTKFASQTKFASGELKAAMSGKVFSVIERKRDHSVAPQEQFDYRVSDNSVADTVGNFAVAPTA
jgi:hypothetical protein